MHRGHDPFEKSVMKPISATLHPVGQVTSPGEFAWACFAAVERRAFGSFHGAVFGGSYAEASAWMAGQLPHVRAFVLIFTRGEGMERFLAGLPAEVASVPMAGGAAARANGAAAGFTHPAAQDLAVLALPEGRWEAVSISAHFPEGEAFDCPGNDPRKFSKVRAAHGSVGAGDFLRQASAAHGLAPDDWDRLALITEDGTMLHLHEDGDTIVSGADLPESRRVRLAFFDARRGSAAILAQARPGALAFGCAGLFGLFGTDRPWEAVMPTTYLFGELAVANGVPRFANLTFSLLIPRP
jgi:hypothetical protein